MRATYLLLLITLGLFISCEENLDKDNVPALQASRNGEFFGSDQVSVTNNADGTVTIAGENPLERLRFVLTSSNPGVYPLGQGSPNEAIYTFNNQQQFSTRTGESNGTVVLSANSPEGTVSGDFSFVSYTPNAQDTLTMRKGVIYQVPFGTEVGSDIVNTVRAMINGTALNPTTVATNAASGVVIVNANNSNTTLLLSFPQNVTVGSYDITATGNYRASVTNNGTTADAIDGTLDITIVNAARRQYSGIFSFVTGPPSNVTVTQGSFTVTL
ncbi:DUF6252 family protein [Nonlabens agnitus]|uniref:Uncharacterized protein n=1 Tax=Nonlabens agnitus TaxID=870484 RepID=A0A2S9WVH7_9FLAO|nr:DUF6252 family protein [Nonlabens agnitus]PRP67490.1 hypothetical protein BST86_10490 [Nonlabens agnitus]